MTDCVGVRPTPALVPMDVAKDVNAGWWLLLKNASKMTQSTGQAEKGSQRLCMPLFVFLSHSAPTAPHSPHSPLQQLRLETA